MDEAERCRRVGLVHQGRMLLEGPPERLLAEYERAGHPRPTFEQLFIDQIERAAA
jgi:ABC-type multidrug transport system ATPase subunit